jgi:hypothetical protein
MPERLYAWSGAQKCPELAHSGLQVAGLFLRPGTLFFSHGDQHFRGPKLVAQAGATDRTLGSQYHPQAGRVRDPQRPKGHRISDRPMALDSIQANDDDALTIKSAA